MTYFVRAMLAKLTCDFEDGLHSFTKSHCFHDGSMSTFVLRLNRDVVMPWSKCSLSSAPLAQLFLKWKRSMLDDWVLAEDQSSRGDVPWL